MEGWSWANTNTGPTREDLHRWARFPPFQIQSPVVPSAICCPPPYPPAAVNSWACHSLEPLIMGNQSLLYLFIYLYTVRSQVSSLRRRLLPSKHAHGVKKFSRGFSLGSDFTSNIKRWLPPTLKMALKIYIFKWNSVWCLWKTFDFSVLTRP